MATATKEKEKMAHKNGKSSSKSSHTYLNLIAGKWVPARSGKSFENTSPADRGDVIGTFPDSDHRDVEAAIASAQKAYEEWRLTPPPRRGEILYKAGQILEERKEELAQLMTREMGKILRETRGDVQEAIDMAYYAAGEGRRMFGITTTSELQNKMAMAMRMPVGVSALITPWNFPMAIPSWKLFPALICGNTVIIKPASDTPASAHKLVEVLMEAGVPAGVINIVHGSGSRVGSPLASHKDVRLVSFTGSSDVGRGLAEICGKALRRLSLELGGKNAEIVMDDADLDLAIEGAVWGAFGTAGQRCTATSRILVHKKVAGEFTKRFVDRVKKMKVGNGLESSTDMGPVVNASQVEKAGEYVQIGKKEGAKLLCGGEALTSGSYRNGYFFQPTVFGNVTPKMRIAQEEIFNPLTAIIEFRDFPEAVKIHNDTAYGLSSSIYTQDVNWACRAVRDLEAGITYVNAPTIGAEVHLPFGGVKDTGNGHRDAGPTMLDVFSEWKSVFFDYSGRLQKAQIDHD